MRIHDKLHTHISMKKRSVYICSEKDSLHGVYVYIYVCLAACLSKQLGIASRQTSLFLCELCVELAPYRSFARSNWNAFSQLAAMYKRPRKKRTKAGVAINSIMHAALFLLMLVDGIVVVVVCYYHRNTFIHSFVR